MRWLLLLLNDRWCRPSPPPPPNRRFPTRNKTRPSLRRCASVRDPLHALGIARFPTTTRGLYLAWRRQGSRGCRWIRERDRHDGSWWVGWRSWDGRSVVGVAFRHDVERVAGVRVDAGKDGVDVADCRRRRYSSVLPAVSSCTEVRGKRRRDTRSFEVDGRRRLPSYHSLPHAASATKRSRRMSGKRLNYNKWDALEVSCPSSPCTTQLADLLVLPPALRRQ